MNNSNNIEERYGRQLLLKEFGAAGQEKLLQSRVLVIGAGGLGCSSLQYLAAAGIGHIGIVDSDMVALHNLHRQVLYTVNDIGRSKAVCAAMALRQLNPDIHIEAFNQRLVAANALALLQQFDIVVDGSDNFSTRYMVNDACVLLNKPLIFGAVSRFEGQVAVFNYRTAEQKRPVNYRDLFPQPPADGEVANCAETGVLGVLPGIIGSMQANETIKLIAGIGRPLINSLLTYNALDNQLLELEIAPRAGTAALMPSTGAVFEQTDYDWLCGVEKSGFEINVERFNTMLHSPDMLVADVRELNELPVVDEFTHISVPFSVLMEQWPETGNETIIVFCQSGKRSLQAARQLAERYGNSKKIFSLAGGILQWKQQQAV
jgi:sulfur-carrier protein adenylyltransferase/sulfurtransferase